jgi:hypothetical protein
MKLEFLYRFSKIAQILNIIRIRLMGNKFLHAEGRTDLTKLTVAFCNFANAPKTDSDGICISFVVYYLTATHDPQV